MTQSASLCGDCEPRSAHEMAQMTSLIPPATRPGIATTGPDEHVIGAVVIFSDIINLFLLILQLVGLGRGR